MDGGTAVAAVTQAAPAAAAQVPAQAAQAPALTFHWVLVPFIALVILFLVEVARALARPGIMRARTSETDAGLTLGGAAVLGGVLAVWQNALWATMHTLPAAGVVILALCWMRTRGTRSKPPPPSPAP